MTEVYVSIGSNVDREKYIKAGVSALRALYSNIICSPVYENPAIGFEGDDFLNLVVRFTTDNTVTQVDAALSKIEDENQRDRSAARFSPRTLDLDLLLFDDLMVQDDGLTLPRPEIYQQAFVLKPLADIAGNRIDPKTGQTFGQLWQEFTANKPSKLTEIPFTY